MPQGCGVPRGALQIPGGSWEEGRAKDFAARLSHPVGSAQRSLVAPATPCTAGDHSHPPCRGRRRIRHGSKPAAPSAPSMGSPCTPSPPREQAWPRNRACGCSNLQEVTVSRRRAKSTAGETSRPPLSSTAQLPCMFLWKFRCTFAHKRTLKVYQGEDACVLGRGSPGDLDGGSCWGCPFPASFPTVSISISISHFAKKPHSSGCCLLACTLTARQLGRGCFMPSPVSERLLPMSCSQCLQPSVAISLPNEPFIYITSGMFGLHQSN